MLRQRIFELVGFFGLTTQPPAYVVEAAYEVVLRYFPNMLVWLTLDPEPAHKRLKEIVMAFGCGYCRVSIPGLGDWNDIWPKAFAAVYQRVRVWVRKTSNCLEYDWGIGGFAEARRFRDDDSVAVQLTSRLVKGRCTCFLQDIEDDDYWESLKTNGKELNPNSNQQKRLARCQEQHSLLGWDPTQISLRSFLARAVKGDISSRSGGRRLFAVGGLVKGMYYGCAHEEIGLSAVEVLAWRCRVDGQRNFYGLPCCRCQQAQRGRVTAPPDCRLITVKWILMPSDRGGAYYSVKYWCCTACGHFYPAIGQKKTACPICDCFPGRGAKQTTVWIQRQGANLELDAEVAAEDEPRLTPPALVENFDVDKVLARMDLSDAMRRLPAAQFRLIETCLREQLEWREAASQLGLAPKTTKAQWHQALATMREYLND